jgi:signal transduction histidine kinase
MVLDGHAIASMLFRMSLHVLISEKRKELLERWATAARVSSATPMSSVELLDRMPLFIGELIAALHPAVAPIPDGGSPNAEEHGVQRLRLGFDVGEVIREYGLLHEAVLDLAATAGLTLTMDEAKVLASCLNKGTRDAVTQYQWQRDAQLQRQAAEHLGFVAHELRNPLASAVVAYGIVRRRHAEPSAAADALGRSLSLLSSMIDNALSHAWLKVGAPVRGETVDVLALLREIARDVQAEADEQAITVTVRSESIVLEADPRLLGSAISNLVRNALKFSRRGATVSVRAWRHEARVLIEVEDQCGGLPAGKTEELFSPFVQKGVDRSGFGLGLAIARQAAESHNGTIKVRNLPGHGCVFVIDLPATNPREPRTAPTAPAARTR